MKRFDLYFLRVFLQSLLLVLVLSTTVYLVVDVLLNLDKIRSFSDVARGAALFYWFNLPPILYLLYPVSVFAAGMFALARVIRARELLLLEASGVSPRRALAAIMIPCLLLGFAGLALRQLALPDLNQAARESPYGAFEFRKGKRVSVRDDDGNMWFVRRYNLDSRTLEDVRILDAGGTRVLVAPELRWREDLSVWWSTREAVIHDLEALTAAESNGAPRAVMTGEPPFGRLFPADFARRKRGFADRTLTELWHQSGSANRELRVHLWHELWHPFGGFILMMCGVGLIAGRNSRGMVRAGSLALACVIGMQLGIFWFETLARSGAMSPALGASLSPALFGALGLWVYART